MMLYLLSISLTVLTVIGILAALRARLPAMLLVLLIPFMIFNAGFSWHTIESLKGMPLHSTPRDDSRFLWAQIGRPYIYVVAQHSDQPNPRFYAMPYSDEAAKKIAAAMRATAQGLTMMMRFPGRSDRGNPGADQPEIEFYQFRHEELVPKDG